MHDLFRHLPFALAAFFVLVLGLTDQAVGADLKTFATLLAPVLWLGLYLVLGAERTAK